MKDEFVIERAVKNQAEEIYFVMQSVYRELEDKTLFAADNFEFVRKHIEKNGFILTATCGGDIAAYLLVRLPGEEPDNLGYDLGFDRKSLMLTAHYESAAVLRRYRGKSLQAKLFCAAEPILKAEGIRHIAATVSPDNAASIKSFEKCGFKRMLVKEKYGGLTRIIMQKNI